jgi:hypothetical protein
MRAFPPKHLAGREAGLGPARKSVFGAESVLILLAVVLTLTMILANLPDRSGSSAAPGGQVSDQTAGASPAGAGTSGNLVSNWSFEQDLAGWRVVGPADAGREPQGRTSGSCATVRAGGSQPEQIGLALPGVVQAASKGDRYVASAWVRSTAPGLRVSLRLVGSGAKPERSQTSTTTLPGVRWRRVIVDHTVTADGANLDLEVTAQAVQPGDALLVDEVIVRQG